jgi:hypothetical protein
MAVKSKESTNRAPNVVFRCPYKAKLEREAENEGFNSLSGYLLHLLATHPKRKRKK